MTLQQNIEQAGVPEVWNPEKLNPNLVPVGWRMLNSDEVDPTKWTYSGGIKGWALGYWNDDIVGDSFYMTYISNLPPTKLAKLRILLS